MKKQLFDRIKLVIPYLLKGLLVYSAGRFVFFIYSDKWEHKDIISALIFFVASCFWSEIDGFVKNRDLKRQEELEKTRLKKELKEKRLLEIHTKLYQLQYTARQGLKVLPHFNFSNKIEFGNFISLCLLFAAENPNDTRFAELFNSFAKADMCLPLLTIIVRYDKKDGKQYNLITGFPHKNDNHWIMYKHALEAFSKYLTEQLNLPNDTINFHLYDSSDDWINQNTSVAQAISEESKKLSLREIEDLTVASIIDFINYKSTPPPQK